MGFWFALFLFVGTTVVSALLQKHPKDAQAASKGEFQFPTAEEGRPIPVVFGTCLLKGPNVTWWGDLKVKPIKKKSGGFLGIGAKSVTVGYKYFVGMMMAICHGPVDAVLKILVSDKDMNAVQSVVGSPENCISASIQQVDVFGGEDKEGGIAASCRLYRGIETQLSDPYLTSQWGETAPALRGLCYIVVPSGYVGTSNYIKNWSFEVQRFPKPAGMNAAKATIGGSDANPAYMLFEILSDTKWGLGIPSSRFDTASFQAAADTLHTEGLGMSIILDSENSADAVISDICRTTDAVLFTDPSTGLWTLKLIRADYNHATLTEFTADDLLEAPAWSRGLWSDTVNEIKVEYTDRAASYQTRIAQAQESANYATQAALSSETMQFKGVSTWDTAQKLAMREIKTHSYPLAQFRLTVNRKGWNLRPGSVFKLTWDPPSGTAFEGMVLRATNIRYGDMGNPAIEVEAVEDIFSVASTAYPNPGTSWVDPVGSPSSVIAQKLIEAPYWIDGNKIWAIALAGRPDQISIGAEVWSNTGGAFALTNSFDYFTPSGVLASSYTEKMIGLDSTGFTLAAGGCEFERIVDASTDAMGRDSGLNLVYFEDTGEIAAWTTSTLNEDGTLTVSGVQRGCLDTVQGEHSAGARVWFLTLGGVTTTTIPYLSNATVNAKILPRTSRAVLPIASASQMTITTSGRASMSYPPGNVKINTASYGSWPSTIVGDAALTWTNRSRSTMGIGGALVYQDNTTTATLEGTIKVDVLVGASVAKTTTGITAEAFTFTATERIAANSDGTQAVRFRITPQSTAGNGTVRTTPPVVMTGFGMTFGLNFGGIQS